MKDRSKDKEEELKAMKEKSQPIGNQELLWSSNKTLITKEKIKIFVEDYRTLLNLIVG